MKEENERISTSKIVENSAILIFFLIILIILVPLILKIVYNMSLKASMISAKGTIDVVKSYYIDMNLNYEVSLPFKVVFYEEGYQFYEKGQKVDYKKELNIKNIGKLPQGGSVEILSNGTVKVKDLTFGNFTCNQVNENNLICDNNSNWLNLEDIMKSYDNL